MAMKKADGTVSAGTTAAPDAKMEAEVLGEEGGGEQAVALLNPQNMVFGGFDGDTEGIAVRLPFLQISYAQGKLEAFRKGSLVLGGSDLLANPGDPLRITVLSARAYWKEYVSGTSYDPNYIPKVFATVAEVVANGGSVKWDNEARKPPTYKTAVRANILIEQPEGVMSGYFGIKLGGKMYAPAQWGTDKTAAAVVAPILKSDAGFALRERGLFSGVYELRTASKKFESGFQSFVPVLKLVGMHPDDTVRQIKELFGASLTSAPDIGAAGEVECQL